MLAKNHKYYWLITITCLVVACKFESDKSNSLDSSTLSEKQNKNYRGDFIGYIHNLPVFYSSDSCALYQIPRRGSVKLIKFIDCDHVILFVSDSVCVSQSKMNNNLIIQRYDSERTELELDRPITWLTSDELGDTLFYFDSFENGISMIVPKNLTIRTVLTDGLYPKVGNSCLFFSKYMEPENSETGSVLLKAYKPDLKETSMVIADIHEEWYLSPDEQLIACKLVRDGKWVNCIYNVANKEQDFFELEGFDNTYFSLQDDAFVYYKQGNIVEDTVIFIND